MARWGVFTPGQRGASIRHLPLIVAAVASALILLAGGILAAIDHGAFDRNLAGALSRAAGRRVAFDSLHTHLLSLHPRAAFEGLRVANPAWAGPADLFRARRLDVTLRWAGLVSRRRAVSRLELIEPDAHLVRLTRERNSWSSGKSKGGDGPGMLAAVDYLRIAGGRFSLDDRVRDLRLSGTFAHDPASSSPFTAAGQGVLQGGAISLEARGGRLNRRGRNEPYPFAAKLQDGASFLEASGVTAHPLRFDGFDLEVAARGPNLGNMEYVIGVGLPNSAPYHLTAHLSRKGPTTRATNLAAEIGMSDFSGAIVSDGSGARRRITIDLKSNRLHAADVDVLLRHRPPHVSTRSVSGAVKQGPDDGRLLSAKPIDWSRFRKRDYVLKLAARTFVIGGMADSRLTAEGRMDKGVFDLKPFLLQFPSGRIDGTLRIDVNGAKPSLALDGRLAGARLSSLAPKVGEGMDGVTNARVRIAGAGGSWREIGRAVRGRASLTLKDGQIEKSKANFISGAVIQGAVAALFNKDAKVALPCAAAQFDVGGGLIRSRRTLLVTGAGVTSAEGAINLADETIGMTLYGRPTKARLFSINKPVVIAGPMLKPQTKLGGAGEPAAEPPKVAEEEKPGFCSALLAEAGRF